MDATIEKQLREVAGRDDESRAQVLDALRKLSLDLEQPDDTLYRLMDSGMQLPAARIAADMAIFNTLAAAAPKTLSIDELTAAAPAGSSPTTVARVMRYLASVDMVHEAGPGRFQANKRTEQFAKPAYQGALRHVFDGIGPILQVFPGFLAETHYADVVDAAKTAAQKAYKTDLPVFMFVPTMPESFAALQQFMTVQPQGREPWFAAFPFADEVRGFEGDGKVLVDVGGGFGHQCMALLAAFPDLKLQGRLLNQELPQTLAQAPPIDGVDTMVHNFFEPQPVHGAKFYYMRNILHDWPDEKCLVILQSLLPALGPHSSILIDEIVLPAEDVHWHASGYDLVMMSSLGSRERTEKEWHELLDKAGLKIVRIDQFVKRQGNAIIQAAPE